MSDPARPSVESLHATLIEACAHVRQLLAQREYLENRGGVSLEPLNREIREAKQVVHAARLRARAARCERAVSKVRDFLRDAEMWLAVLEEAKFNPALRERLAEARNAAEAATKEALNDPPEATYKPQPGDKAHPAIGPGIMVADPTTPKIPEGLSGRAALVALGIVKEGPPPGRDESEAIRLLDPPLWAQKLEGGGPRPIAKNVKRGGPCGKATYTSEEKARLHAGSKGGFRVHTYECAPCRGWHVANADKRRHGG